MRTIYLLSPAIKEEVNALPMIAFSLVAQKIDFANCDTLVFTSKQAVVFADMIDKRWKGYPCIAIGPATAKQIKVLGGEVIFEPKNFYGEVLASDIATFFKERKLLYLRPKEISFDSKNFLEKKGIVLAEQIIYETVCVKYDKEKAPPQEAIIIFTSPSSVACFLKSFEWNSSYTAVVIGEATLKHLPANVDYAVADEPLIDACIKKAKELQNQKH
ncbi:MAG: Uroporphyrinogen-III synthase [Campylobacterota bacterium]|nr:Uroporphyrinogen-III synthase [Campylobacterota bacterium]